VGGVTANIVRVVDTHRDEDKGPYSVRVERGALVTFGGGGYFF